MEVIKCSSTVVLLCICLMNSWIHYGPENTVQLVFYPIHVDVYTVCELNSQLLKPTRRYCGVRISYYPNSDASYQISILQDGDISPNPGPVVETSREYKSVGESFTYKREQLFDVSHYDACHQRLPLTVWKTLTSLGISRRKRTRRCKRAGVARKNRLVYTAPSASTQTDGKGKSERQENGSDEKQDGALSEKNARGKRRTEDKRAPINLAQVGLWNARSISNKSTCICDLILDSKLNALVITESWLTGDHRDDHVIGDLKSTLPNYDFLQCPRKGSKGGGVCVIHRSSACTSLNGTHKFASFELLDFQHSLLTHICPKDVCNLQTTAISPEQTDLQYVHF